MLSLFYCLLLSAAPENPENFYEVNGSILPDIYDGMILEGSVSAGHGQPDYLLDFSHPVFSDLKKSAKELRTKRITFWDKIEIISELVKATFRDKEYDSPRLEEINRLYRESGQNVPFSVYVENQVGVCREFSILTSFLLKEAGIENRRIYASIELQETSEYLGLIEDHGFVTVKYRNTEYVVDPYSKYFNGTRYQDLLKGWVSMNSPLAPIGEVLYTPRRIVNIRDYPTAWIPKRNCKGIIMSLIGA